MEFKKTGEGKKEWREGREEGQGTAYVKGVLGMGVGEGMKESC